MKDKEKVKHSRRDFMRKAGTVAAASSVGLAANLKIPGLSAHENGLPRYVMVVDMRKCYGCRACTVACKSEFQVPLGVFRTVVGQKDTGTFPAAKRFFPFLYEHWPNQGRVEVPG